MKKIILFFLLVASWTAAVSQVRLGDFPLLLGRGDSVKVPVLVPLSGGGLSNRDMWAHDLAWGKVDSLVISHDSVFEINSGRKIFRWMRSGGSGNGTITKDTALWGKLLGNINLQTDLIAMFNTKQNALTLGTASQYIAGNLTLRTLSTDVLAITDPTYAPLIHTHTFSSITDGTSAVRSLFSAGSGISYNPGTGQITSTVTGTGVVGHIASPLSLSGDTLKLLSVPSSILTGTKDHSFISDLNATVLNYFSALAPVQYNNTTGAFSLDTTNGVSGAVTKGRLYKGLDSVRLLNVYTPGYGLLLSSNQFRADSFVVASRNRLYKTVDSMKGVNLTVFVARDSLPNYPLYYYPPLHVAYDSLDVHKVDSVWIDTASHFKDGILLAADYDKVQSGYSNQIVSAAVSNWILTLNKQSGGSINVALPQYGIGSGLTNNGGTIDLGGTLTRDATISNRNYIVQFGVGGNYIKRFVAYAAGGGILLADSSAVSPTSWTLSNGNHTFQGQGGFLVNNQSDINLASPSIVSVSDTNSWKPLVIGPFGSGILRKGFWFNSVSAPANQILIGTGASYSSYSDFKWNETSKLLQLGTLANGQITATPLVLDLGGTYSNANGANLKFPLFHNGLATYGLGVSSNGSNAQMDFVIGDASGDFAFYSGASPSLLMKLSNAGLFSVGTGTTTGSSVPTKGVLGALDNATASGSVLSAIFRMTQTAATTGSLEALEGNAQMTHSTGNVTLSIGSNGFSTNAGAGTVTDMRGLEGGVVSNSNGAIINAAAMYSVPIVFLNGSTSTVTNSYGLYISSPSMGSGPGVITNRYNIYTADASGINYFNGITKLSHIQGISGTPAVVVGGSVTGTVSVVGNDISGTVTLVITGSSSLATNAELFTLTFASGYNATPNVTFSPANAAAVSNLPSVFVKGTSTSGFSIATAPSTTPVLTTYIWTYKVSN